MMAELFLNQESIRSEMHAIPLDSVRINEHLNPVNSSLYKGRLGFPDGTISFYAVKQRKAFGIDTIQIWNVLLGDCNVDP
jgi:hypothetical protein